MPLMEGLASLPSGSRSDANIRWIRQRCPAAGSAGAVLVLPSNNRVLARREVLGSVADSLWKVSRMSPGIRTTKKSSQANIRCFAASNLSLKNSTNDFIRSKMRRESVKRYTLLMELKLVLEPHTARSALCITQ